MKWQILWALNMVMGMDLDTHTHTHQLIGLEATTKDHTSKRFAYNFIIYSILQSLNDITSRAS